MFSEVVLEYFDQFGINIISWDTVATFGGYHYGMADVTLAMKKKAAVVIGLFFNWVGFWLINNGCT